MKKPNDKEVPINVYYLQGTAGSYHIHVKEESQDQPFLKGESSWEFTFKS
jgi:hypothetical protein